MNPVFQKWENRLPYYALMKMDEDIIENIRNLLMVRLLKNLFSVLNT